MPLDHPGIYNLNALGRAAPAVLTEQQSRTPAIAYDVPLGAARRGLYYKVALDFEIEISPSARRGFGYVTAKTDGRASASAEFVTRRRGGKLVINWNTAALHEYRKYTTRQRNIRVAFSNYVRLPATTPGRHYLTFALEQYDGFRARRVVISPKSGIIVTRQPLAALDVSVTIVGPTPRVGRPVTLRISTRNRGVQRARSIRFRLLTSSGLSVDRRSRPEPITALGSGRVREQNARVSTTRPGPHFVQVLAESSVGSALGEASFSVRPAPDAMSAAPAGGSATADGKWRPPVAGVVVVGCAMLLYGAWKATRRR
jgi:hypothetical protein